MKKHNHQLVFGNVEDKEIECPWCHSINNPKITFSFCAKCRMKFELSGSSNKCFHCSKTFHWHKGIGIFKGELTIEGCWDEKGNWKHRVI